MKKNSVITLCSMLIIQISVLLPLAAQTETDTARTEIQETSAGQTDSYIKRIEFTGLKKTKESYMQEQLKSFVGIQESVINLNAVETQLRAEGLFSEVNVEIIHAGEEEAVLSVTVKEKITFIPLPFISYSNSGLMGGACIMDMNAFGRKNNFVLGGIFSADRISGISAFSKPASGGFVPGFSASLSVSKSTVTVRNTDDDNVLEYGCTSLDAGITVTEKLTKNLSARAGIKYSFRLTDTDLFDTLHQGALNFSMDYAAVKWNGWYLLNSSIGFQEETAYTNENSFSQSITFRGTYQLPLFDRFRFILSGAALCSFNNHEIMYSSPRAVGASILPSKFRSEKMAAASLKMEAGLFRTKIGMFSLYGSYECTAAEDIDKENVYCHGAGGGAKFYMSKIAFPAFSFGLSYNLTKNYLQFAASIGVSL